MRQERKVAKHYDILILRGTRGSTNGLAKAVAAEPSGGRRNAKMQAVVARIKRTSQYRTKLSCCNRACRFGAKHMFFAGASGGFARMKRLIKGVATSAT